MSDYSIRVLIFKNDQLAVSFSFTQSMAGLASNINSLAVM